MSTIESIPPAEQLIELPHSTELMEMILQSSKRLMEVLDAKRVGYQREKVGAQERGHDQKLRLHGAKANWNIHYHKDKWKTCSHEKLILKASQSLSDRLLLSIGRSVVWGDVEEKSLSMYDLMIKNSFFARYKSVFEHERSDSSPWEQAKTIMAAVVESLESEISTIDSNISTRRNSLVENAKMILGARS